MLTQHVMTVAALATLAATASAQKKHDVSGNYAVVGIADGTPYHGTAVLTSTGGEMYTAKWNFGTTVLLGICFRDDDKLSCASCPKDLHAYKQYLYAYLVGDSTLDAVFFMAGDKKTGKQTSTAEKRWRQYSVAGWYTTRGENPDYSKFTARDSVKQVDKGVIQAYQFTFVLGSTKLHAVGVSAELGARPTKGALISAAGECSGKRSSAVQYSIKSSPSGEVRLTGIFVADNSGHLSTGTEDLAPPVAVVSKPTIRQITISPAAVTGGTVATATVTLYGIAPAGGATVALTSLAPLVARIPATMTIAAGSSTGTFQVTTLQVTTGQEAAISGSAGGSTQTAAITVTPDSTLSPSPSQLAADSVAKAPNCSAGCFDARGTTDGQSVSLRGGASVSADDGSRFDLVLGLRDTGASYISFARDPGGAPRPGTFALADHCSEEPKTDEPEQFSAEFVTRAYAADAAIYLSAGGSLVIERVTGGLKGRFDLVACRFDAEGKRHDTRIRGTFDGAR